MRVDPNNGQDWKAYAKSLIIFSLAGWLLLYFILRTQTLWNWTGLNPQGFHSAPWNVTFNTTSSFVTNTNWQYYSGETTMSYFSQMVGLTVQNFVSAAVGIVGRGGADPGDYRAVAARASAISGGIWSARCCTCCCRSRSWSRWCWCSRVRSRILSHYLLAHTVTGGSQSIAQGSGCLAGGDQGARDQWRRVLQHEFGASVRESVGVHEPGRDAAGADHPGCDRVHLWPDGRQAPAGLCDLRDDDDHVPRRGASSRTSPRRTAPRRSTRRGYIPA